jgi:hypothetical protein
MWALLLRFRRCRIFEPVAGGKARNLTHIVPAWRSVSDGRRFGRPSRIHAGSRRAAPDARRCARNPADGGGFLGGELPGAGAGLAGALPAPSAAVRADAVECAPEKLCSSLFF